MGKLTVEHTSIAGLNIAKSNHFADARGEFTRCFCDEELAEFVAGKHIKQINLSKTRARGAIRGMHFQIPPFSEVKFVRCIKGRVFDVAVDLRAESKSLFSWHGVELSANNKLMMIIPERFAHGFQTLEEDCELLYLHTREYTPQAEGGLRYDDPLLSIKWPLSVTDISAKDGNYQQLSADFKGID